MPRNLAPTKRLEDLPLAERKTHPVGGQDHWYLVASQFCNALSVLDVGAGDGRGIRILKSHGASRVVGIDLSPLDFNSVLRLPLEDVRDAAFDIVTAMDVIEHVEDDRGFLEHLLRVAHVAVFISTPNYAVWECKNPFHVREYDSTELLDLLISFGHSWVSWTAGKNREADPPIRIMDLADGQASFGILIRSEGCTDEQWALYEEAPRLLTTLPADLSRLSRSAEEWMTFLTKAAQGSSPSPSPFESAKRMVEQATSLVLPTIDEMPLPPNDAVKILRFGRAGPLQQKVLLSWLMNNFVLGPEGPWTSSK